MAPTGEAAPFTDLSGLDGLDGLVGAGTSPDDLDLPVFVDLTPFEVEHFVQEIRPFQLEEVGSANWLTQHERLEKMNWTAHNQAKEGLDEFVVDQLNTQEKVPSLIYDLMLIEVWKERIWPLVKAKMATFSSLRTYIPVYHEATVVNLLEICLYHRTTCEEAGDALVDLVDFCVRKLRHVMATPNEELVRQVGSAKECCDWDTVRMLDEQFYEVEFQVCMCAISVIRFLTDHRVAMPLAVTTRLLETHDILLLLVPLMEKAPWVRKNRINGRIEKFEEQKWQVVEPDDVGRLPKMHTQVWLAIYNLVMDGECRARYELSSHRRENLLRLRRYINEVVVDQLPPLTNLHRTLEELSISGQFTGAAGAPAPSPFLVELVAEVRETLLRTFDGKWQEVADAQLRDVLVKETPEELKRLGEMISVPKDWLEEEDAAAATRAGREAAPPGAKAAWEAVTSLTAVRSTASFFAAARRRASGGGEEERREVLILSAPPQPEPEDGGRLRLELRRGERSYERESESAFLLSVDAPGISVGATQEVPFVSQKGAARTASQLREQLSKPGRESLLEMYSSDVAEFSVPVAGGADDSVDLCHLHGLALRHP